MSFFADWSVMQHLLYVQVEGGSAEHESESHRVLPPVSAYFIGSADKND